MSFKRIVVPRLGYHAVNVEVDTHDYDREDDVWLVDPDGERRLYTQAHVRTFREVIDKAHEARRLLTLPDDATIVRVSYYEDERPGNVIHAGLWTFTWCWYGYPVNVGSVNNPAWLPDSP